MIKPQHLMLIDDDEDDQRILTAVLRDIDPAIKVTVADNGEEGLNMIQAPGFHHPDFIFLDINMPILNGFECLEVLKNDEVMKHIPVIMYSTSANMREVERTYSLGANLYVVKPFKLDEFYVVFKKIFALDWQTYIPKPSFHKFVLSSDPLPEKNHLNEKNSE